ncbi:MAG TPA: hypothetical protein VJN96_20085 [Vicinamibacterales bacterium]|nr:hypothetical protein [Vicinamibacterales bacterium]
MTDRAGGASHARWALACFVALAVFHTWPLSSAPWRLSLNHHADAQLNAWIVSWIAHTLPAAPTHLFDANIFAPEPATLTYSEPLIAPALLVAPVRWLGGSPVLAFNLLTIAGLALTGWSAWFVAWRWTGSTRAALVAGALAAFNVHTLTRLAHPAATHAWGLPLAWYWADAAIDRPGRRTALMIGLVVAAVAATSVYLLAFVVLIIAVVAVMRARGVASFGTIGAGVAIGVALAAPILLPYVRLGAGGATRPIEMVAQFSASPAGYLSSTSVIDAIWTRRFFANDVNVMFAGVGALVLSAVGLVAARRLEPVTRRRIVALVIVAVAGVVLSLGPSTAIYRWLYALVWPLRGLRAAARFGHLYLVTVSMLAAFGWVWLERRVLPRPRVAIWLAACVVLLVTAEAWQGPVRTVPFSRVPAIYSLVADAPDPVRLVEVPFYPPEAVFENGEYVFNSTAHWRPLMNGYSGYTPDSYRTRAAAFWFFPEAWAIDAIRREGATHLMVHLSRFSPEEAAEITRVLLDRRDLELIGSDPLGNRLYKVK